MKNRILLMIGVLLLNAFPYFAQALKIPYKDVGACPFECCTYREWTVNKDTALLKNSTDKSPIVFKVKKGEKVQGVTGIVFTTKAGIGKALQNTNFEIYNEKNYTTSNIRIKKGESFQILTYLGEGFYKIWFKGRFLQAESTNPKLKKISNPKSTWWVKIRNRKGQVGWTKLTDNFDDMDSCG